MEEARAPPLPLVAVLRTIARVFALTGGRHKLEIVFENGEPIQARPTSESPKLTRHDLDLIWLSRIDGD